MSTDEEAQQDEMLALESIFVGDTFQLYPGDIRSGQIKIKVELSDPFFVTTETPIETVEEHRLLIPPGEGPPILETKYRVQFLPHLTLHFTLPKNYPSQTRPNFTLSSHWLHRACLSILCQKLDELWEENKGMGVLFTWANYLQTNTLRDLGISDHYNVAWLQRPLNLAVAKRSISRRAKKRGSLMENNSIANDSALEDNPLEPDLEPDEGVGAVATGSSASAPPPPPPETSCSTNTTTSNNEQAEANTSSKSQQITTRKRKNKPKKKSAIDQRAASDSIPRKDGKEVLLLDDLLFYNEEAIRETFLKSTHSCDICFTMKIGRSCVRFRCGHVFCEECVTGFFTTNITDGNVDQVKCLAFNCKMRPTPELVKQLVGETLWERYDQILLKRALENMSDIIYCPRPKCHNPVLCDPNEKCAVCTVCSYTFCSTCKMVYHGVEPCRFKDADMKEVFKKYTEGTPDEKKALLKAYGEKQLKVLVENVLSEQWIQKESKQCPHCKVPIEKFEGCNKVTCFKCNTYFCWLCLKQLEHGNPYFHFNDPSSKCYNNLFQNMENDEDDDDAWFIMDDDDDDTSDDEDINDLDFEGSDYEDFDDDDDDYDYD